PFTSCPNRWGSDLAAVPPLLCCYPSVIHCTFTSDGASNLDFGPQLDDLRGRDVEVVPGRARIARHRGEQPLPPHCHAFSGGGDHGRAAEQEPGLQRLQYETVLLAVAKRVRYVRAVHEPEIDDDPIEAVLERFNLDPFTRSHPRYLADNH